MINIIIILLLLVNHCFLINVLELRGFSFYQILYNESIKNRYYYQDIGKNTFPETFLI